MELALAAAFFLALLFSGLSTEIRDMLGLPRAAQIALYTLIVMTCYYAATFPLNYYQGFVLQRRFGISRRSLKSWFTDTLRGDALSLLAGLALVTVIYQLTGLFPGMWWLWAFAFVALLMIVLTKLAPVIIIPLFFRLKPLADEELKQRLLRLAARCGADIKEIFVIKLGSKAAANAMLMGFGNTRRIAVSDALLRDYTPEEIEAIVGHELGHHMHGDVARLIAVQCSLLLGGFYGANLALGWAASEMGFSGISDIGAFPLLVLVFAAVAMVFVPVVNAYGRRLEYAADRHALELTNNPEAFVTMLAKITDQNLAEADPPGWAAALLYDHPPYSKRIEQALRYGKEKE